MKKRVLLIDPWGIANTSEYLNGLIHGLSPLTELTVFTNCYFECKSDAHADIHKVFFKKSQNMPEGSLRTIFRGIEYIDGYRQIISFMKSHMGYDVVHINWLLQYKLDIIFLRWIKRYTKKLVYTAHNVIPHINGTRYIADLAKIYHMCDRIILHGESVKQELNDLFPDEVYKVYIQKHGSNLKPSTGYDTDIIDSSIKMKINSYVKKYIFFGNIFYNKGIDRIVKIWDERWKDALLIVAGKKNGEYLELTELEYKMEHSDNILWLNGYVDDNTLNYLIDQSQMILMPYRHASMSGVIFTAADFNKTVLVTDVGALKEYIHPGIDSVLVENDDEKIKVAMMEIIQNYTNGQLKEMGCALGEHVKESCAWTKVCGDLVEGCY